MRKLHSTRARRTILATVAVLSVSGATVAGAAREPVLSEPLVDGLAGPLQFEVSATGRLLIGQSFSGTVTEVDRRGERTDLFGDPGVDGVARGAFGTVIYTYTDPEAGTGELRFRAPGGEVSVIADLGAYEATENPDAAQSYGLFGLDDECAAQLPADAGILPYTGIVESHPYAVTPVAFGWYVADAAANAILHVDWRGAVTTVVVLPPEEPVEVTADAAAANGLPECVVGSSYVAEPVPTDVEIGRGGKLYVSTLPGGPEDPSLGARGSVYEIDQRQGTVVRIATGFAGAVNLAIGPRNTIYVAELFGNRVSAVVDGGPQPVVEVPAPSGLEWARNRLYVATDTFGSGTIRTITF